MKQGSESKTAILSSVLRAAHQILDQDPKILADPIVVGLTDGSTKEEIEAMREKLQSPLMKLFRSLFVLRSRFTEDQLRKATKSGIRQYIILGAGLDTFAYRQPEWAKKLQIIEIDHPESQAFKRNRLQECGIKTPENLKFVSIDLENETIDEAFNKQQINCDVLSFFSWLGVTQYLPKKSIEDVLKFVSSFPKLSGISFTIYLPITELNGLDAEVHTFSTQGAASVGEPWVSFYNPADCIELLKRIGFSEVFHQTPESAAANYFDNRSDGLSAPVMEQCLCATV